MFNISIDKELSKFGIKRDPKLGIGKRVGDKVWLHKDYGHKVMPQQEIDAYASALPEGFSFDVLRIGDKGEIGFISSPDFNESSEPIVSDSIKVVKNEDGSFTAGRLTKQQADPLIYHHKWLFVADDYNGFNCEEEKLRSYEWKGTLGVNRAVSNKIGRLSFWNEWLAETGLEKRTTSEALSAPEAPSSEAVKNNKPKATAPRM